jgi:hypothetical protein
MGRLAYLPEGPATDANSPGPIPGLCRPASLRVAWVSLVGALARDGSWST